MTLRMLKEALVSAGEIGLNLLSIQFCRRADKWCQFSYICCEGKFCAL
jgi:hypothetical protein